MSAIDYAILLGYLILLAGIAWRFRKSSVRPAAFFLADRRFGALPVGLSVMVTTFSAVNYLALPGEVSRYGLYVVAAFPAFFLAAWPVTRWWMPKLRALRPVSVYALLEERFDRRVRLLASALFLVWRLFWMAVALYASSRIMSALTGADFLTALLLCGIAAAGYSSIGGMKAVVWTDVLQFAVLFGSIVLGVVLACQENGWGARLAETGRLKPFFPADWQYFSLDPRCRITFWSALIGSFVAFLTRFGADQMVMQRFLAARSLQEARRGLWINGIASTLSLGLLAVFGLAVHAFVLRRQLAPDLAPVQMVAALLRSFPAGAAGLIGAGLLAATMSSIDSGLNSCAAALAADWLPGKTVSPRRLTWLLALPVIAAAALLLPELNRQQTLFVLLNKTVNAIGTPLLAMMLAALFWKKVRASAVLYGAMLGTVLTVIAGVAVTGLALHYYAVLSLLLTLAAIAVGNGLLRGR